MSRPQLIRADTIDLQDPIAPSAQDHSRQPTHPAAIGAGPPAPHQAETLREVAAEVEQEESRSPRVSNEDWGNGATYDAQNGIKHDQQDASAVAQNGGLTGAEDADMADAEGDDGMEDDMMDKISSSPSISDGGYFLPTPPPRLRSHSPESTPSRTRRSIPALKEVPSSSPIVRIADYYPLNFISSPHMGKICESSPQSDSSLYSQDLDISIYSQPSPPVKVGHRFQNPLGFGNVVHSPVTTPEEVTSSDTSSPRAPSTTYTDERLDVLGPLPGDRYVFFDDYNESPQDKSSSPLYDRESSSLYLEQGFDSSLLIPYESSEEGSDLEESFYDGDPRFVAVGWGVICLQDNLEDIDFEFVYALHTFVATVEGQANATKGDTMVLLDDSNSYWWLVRVVKDSSIGYLPAEHIETPTERLARLNKHRNIDLSATMLGDQESKSKNPLKKAMRRRNAKTVTFSAPTYVEASDIDYSSEEEGDDFYGQEQLQAGQQAQTDDEEKTVEPSSDRTEVRDVESGVSEAIIRKNGDPAKGSSEITRTSDETLEGDKSSGKSRNGTVRNTDSFFKDETVETRKITLTPNLLRDDSSTSTTRTSNDSKEIRQRPSIEKPEKESLEKSRDDKKKKDKKEKDKKPGMLSNLFSRKKKKSAEDEDIDELIYGKKRPENDNARSSPAPSNESAEFVSEDAAHIRQSSPQRTPSKLQKQPRAEVNGAAGKLSTIAPELKAVEPPQTPAPERAPPASSSTEPSMRIVRSESQAPEASTVKAIDSSERARGHSRQTSQDESKSSFTKILRTGSRNTTEPRPEKVKKAKVRAELDDFDSSDQSSPIEEPERQPQPQQIRSLAVEKPVRPTIPGAFPDSYTTISPAIDRVDPLTSSSLNHERLSESPVQVSPMDGSSNMHSAHHPPALMIDSSSQEDTHSQVSSPSPELISADEIDHDHNLHGHGMTNGAGISKKASSERVNSHSTSMTPTSTGTSGMTTWSDAHLRTFFDDDAEIRDLLVVVYDKSGVVPAGPEHPVVGSLFREENKRLAEITNRLDGMLGDWLARKSKVAAR